MCENYRIEKLRLRMLSMQKNQEQSNNKTCKESKYLLGIKQWNICALAEVKMLHQMFKVTAIRFHTAIQRFLHWSKASSIMVCCTQDHTAVRLTCGTRISKLVNLPKKGPIIHHVKLMTLLIIQGLKKITSITISLSQNVMEYVMELIEKWMSIYVHGSLCDA